MNKILKIALVALIGMGFGLNAGPKEVALKSLKWAPFLTSIGLVGATAHNMLYHSRDGVSFINEKFNCGAFESGVAGIAYLMFSVCKYIPYLDKYLDNNFGYCALGALFLNRSLNSHILSLSEKAKENFEKSYDDILKSNDDRMKEEAKRSKALFKTFGALSALNISYRLLVHARTYLKK